MTVCIAAICDNSFIVGAADRLITLDDIEYEQPQPKILPLATNTVALTSGDPVTPHTTIYRRTRTALLSATNPTVELIATTYATQFANLRRQRAEKKYLTPLGLTTWNFLNSQTNLAPNIAQELMKQLDDEELGCSAIIAGVDQAGPHIFIIDDPGEAECYDLDGWAAIGSGDRHADQQFIREEYDPSRPFDEAFLLTYLAKRKADVTPGVGRKTDMFWIGSGPDSPYTLMSPDDDIAKQVEKLHSDIVKQEKELSENAKGKIKEYIKARIAKQQPSTKQDQIDPPPGTAGADQPPDIPEGTEGGEPPR